MATVVLGPALLDLSGIRAGDRNMIALTITDKASGNPINLTGQTLTAQARLTASDPVIAITATITVTNAAAGQVTIAWPGAAVAALMVASTEAWSGVWDLQLASGSGDPLTIAAGKLQAVQDVTRP